MPVLVLESLYASDIETETNHLILKTLDLSPDTDSGETCEATDSDCDSISSDWWGRKLISSFLSDNSDNDDFIFVDEMPKYDHDWKL